jgi:hypothetical protein
MSNTTDTTTSNATFRYTLVYGMKDSPSVHDPVNVHMVPFQIINQAAPVIWHWERQGKRIVHATVIFTATGAVVTKLR